MLELESVMTSGEQYLNELTDKQYIRLITQLALQNCDNTDNKIRLKEKIFEDLFDSNKYEKYIYIFFLGGSKFWSTVPEKGNIP